MVCSRSLVLREKMFGLDFFKVVFRDWYTEGQDNM